MGALICISHAHLIPKPADRLPRWNALHHSDVERAVLAADVATLIQHTDARVTRACAVANVDVQGARALHDGLHVAICQQPPQPRNVVQLRPMRQWHLTPSNDALSSLRVVGDHKDLLVSSGSSAALRAGQSHSTCWRSLVIVRPRTLVAGSSGRCTSLASSSPIERASAGVLRPDRFQFAKASFA